MPPYRTCRAPDCAKIADKHGPYCSMHRARLARTGSLERRTAPDLSTIPGEVWRTICGWEDYQVSNFGRVKRAVAGHSPISVLHPHTERDTGYPRVTLSQGKAHKCIRVHVLVAKAFIPNPKGKRTVNHIDCVRTNNLLENLEWATHSEQMFHAYKMGTKKAAGWRRRPSSGTTHSRPRKATATRIETLCPECGSIKQSSQPHVVYCSRPCKERARDRRNNRKR